MKFYYFSILFVVFVHIGGIRGDYYTSIARLDGLLDAEQWLVDNLEKYITTIEDTNKIISSYLDYVDEISEEYQEDPNTYFENPLNAFKIIHRIVSDWKDIEDLVFNNTTEDAYKRNVDLLETVYKPTLNDLAGASRGLLRLQETYALHTEDIARGILMGFEVSPQLSAADCFQLGRSLYESKEYAHALEWLTMSRILFERANSTDTLVPVFNLPLILQFLAPCYFHVGNWKMALKLNEELLALVPDHEDGVRNKVLYENKIQEDRRYLFTRDDFDAKPEPEKSIVKDLYMKVCRGELQQTPAQQRNLLCRYTSNNIPFCLLAPFKMEELNHDPLVLIYHETIYDNEIEYVLNKTDNIERSKIGENTVSTVSEVRTSQNGWLYFDKNPYLNNVAQRLIDITGLSLETAEALQVANYGIGGHYGPHYDFHETLGNFYENSGNRLLTALFYINDVELGGATAFPFLHLAVPPVKRSLLVWYNMHESLELDYRTKHAGCPVVKGSKWICNQWFRERAQEFRRPCSLHQQGDISIAYKGIV